MKNTVKYVKIRLKYDIIFNSFNERAYMNISLRKFTADDAETLKIYEFKNMSTDKIRLLISDWNKNEFNGRYCEVFAAEYGGKTAGWFSMAELPNGKISIGPTVFEPYRCNGIAYNVMKNLLSAAKSKGYSYAQAQIRLNNTASIKLHEKLGYTKKGTIINRNHNEVYIYERNI